MLVAVCAVIAPLANAVLRSGPVNNTSVTAVRLVPVMVTAAPASPVLGVKLATVGRPPAVPETVKLVAEVAVCPPTNTVMLPLVAEAGTVTTSCVVVALLTLAATPLNLTVLLPSAALKLVPVMVTDVPTAPELGVKLATVGRPLAVPE